MYTLRIENAKGFIFELSHNTQNYMVVGVQGLTRPQTIINTSSGGGADGTFFNSARVEQRNIVIELVLNGDIEANRQQLYNIFPMKSQCTIYFKNANRDVKISGYVEVLEGDLFVQQERMQISIICPRPFFEDLNTIYTEMSITMRLFEFPFSIEDGDLVALSEITEEPTCTITNSGDVETGFITHISVVGSYTGSVANLVRVTIYNTTTGKFFGIIYGFFPGDQITINSIAGQMSATAVIASTGETINLLPHMQSGSTWLKLIPGENEFTFTEMVQTGIEQTTAEITFETNNFYGGV